MTPMQRWMSRLAFSFLIFGAILAAHAYSSLRGYGPSLPAWRVWMEFVLAVACFVMGMAGVRARHRGDSDGNDS